jgi:outer membrane protein assembly factor BamD
MKKLLFTLVSIILITSCSHKKPEKTAQELYNDALYYLKGGVYDIAGQDFEKIEDEYPFSQEAKDGLIMSAYSYYKNKSYNDSLRIIDYYIQSNPLDKNLDYLYYLKALNFYDRISSTKKARGVTENADYALLELMRRFPNTKYATDGINRKKTTETYLSGNEMEVGIFYLKNKNNIGAMNHFNYIIKNFPNSNFIPESYYRLTEIYLMLGMNKEAKNTFKVLKNDYNNTKWFKSGQKLINKYL